MEEGAWKAWKTKEMSPDPQECLLQPRKYDPNPPGLARAAIKQLTAFTSIMEQKNT